MSWATTVNDTTKTGTSDGSASDTQTAVNYVIAKAEDGWVITVGAAGGSYTWATGVDGVFPNNTTIQGASPSNRPTVSVADFCTLQGNAGSGKYLLIKDINWQNSGAVDGLLIMGGDSGSVGANYRVTNCTFLNNGGGTARSMFCEAYGLVDNCTFNGTSENRVWCTNTPVGWTGVHTFGTENVVCIEDCTFTNTQTPGSVVLSQALDGDRAMRVTFRHNTLSNCNTETHGYTSGAGNEGLQVEVYDNAYGFVGNGADQADWATHVFRGGTGAVYNNVVTYSGGFGGSNFMVKFRAEQPESYPAPHQPGQGLTALNTLGRVPIYFWDNTWAAVTFGIFGTDEGTMVLDTDYFADTAKPGYTALAYPHPLRGASTNNITFSGTGTFTSLTVG